METTDIELGPTIMAMRELHLSVENKLKNLRTTFPLKVMIYFSLCTSSMTRI